MPRYDSLCEACGVEDTIIIPSSEVENYHKCEACGELKVKRVWRTMPGTTRASYIDSNKTARGKEMATHKQIAQLEVKKANAKPSERADISKEIRNLKKT